MIVKLDENTGYVQEPEVEDEHGPSLFDYLEAAYGVERAESLTIQIWKEINDAGSRAAKIIAAGPPVTKLTPEEAYTEANEIESLIDSIEIAVIGESKSWELGDRDL